MRPTLPTTRSRGLGPPAPEHSRLGLGSWLFSSAAAATGGPPAATGPSDRSRSVASGGEPGSAAPGTVTLSFSHRAVAHPFDRALHARGVEGALAAKERLQAGLVGLAPLEPVARGDIGSQEQIADLPICRPERRAHLRRQS